MKIRIYFISFIFFLIGCSPSLKTSDSNNQIASIQNKKDLKNNLIPNWKKEALHRIDSLRKVDLNITVLDANGNKIENAVIDIKLTKHHFKFGAVINNTFLTTTYADVHKKNLKKYFNSTGFQNALKPKQRHKDREKGAERVFEWLFRNDFYVRGHTLVWENIKNMRPEEKKVMKSNEDSKDIKKKKITKLVKKHFFHALNKWDVQAWDVLNEPIGNHQINDLTSENSFAYWFKLADSIRKQSKFKNVKLFINENRVISGTTKGTYSRPKEYRSIISSIIKEKAPLEGIGLQSRIKHGFVSPKEMYKRLQDFEVFKLPVHTTEFEVIDSDRKTYSNEEKNQIIEQFMLIYASHYLVEGIWHWTFYQNKKEINSSRALFNFDGTPTISGKQWIKTMNQNFTSNHELKTQKEGSVKARIFKGDYTIIIKSENQTKEINLKAIDNQNITVKI